MARVTCVNCRDASQDDMDGMCSACGNPILQQSQYQQAQDPFLYTPDNKPVSASGRRPGEPRSRSGRWQVKPAGSPLRPMNLPPREDKSWFDDGNAVISQAQELRDFAEQDFEDASAQARHAWNEIESQRLLERSLTPALRHDLVELLARTGRQHEAWQKLQDAQARYDRLLAEFEQALDRPDMGLRPGPMRRSDDPYADSRKDDGSLAWAERDGERRLSDRRTEPTRHVDFGGTGNE